MHGPSSGTWHCPSSIDNSELKVVVAKTVEITTCVKIWFSF